MELLTIILCVLLGATLMFLELFIPGGVAGACGFLLSAYGIYGIFMEFGPAWGILCAGVLLLTIVMVFYWWVHFLPRTRIGRKIVLADEDARDWHGYDPGQQNLLRQSGVAHTTLRPAGIVLIGGRRYDVVTRGELIQAGTPVAVVEVEGNRIVVEETAILKHVES